MTAENDPELLEAAYAALATLATDKELHLLTEKLRRATDPRVRQAVEQALCAVALRSENRDQVATALLQAIPTASIDERISLVNTLGRLQTDAALMALRTEYESGNEDLKRAVLRALGAWSHPAPAPMLEQIAASDPDQSRRLLALRGFIDLLKLPSDRGNGLSVAMLSRAMTMAERAEEKRAALSVLATLPSRAALEVAGRYLDDADVGAEAKAAVETIQKSIEQ
jgi:hypothetical protein